MVLVHLNSGKSSKYDSIKTEKEFNEYLKHELYDKYIKQCEAIRSGLACVVPINIFALYTSDEVEQLVTGPRKINVELLKTKTNLDGYNEKDVQIQWFWELLGERFSDKHCKQLFLFVWGRSRLPGRASEFSERFTIVKKDMGYDDQKKIDQLMPLGKTCFFSMHLPPYSTIEIMEEKIIYAIENCSAIDLDNEPGGDEIERAMREIPDEWTS